jgi:concentrative nucleoside transporter, CNT family
MQHLTGILGFFLLLGIAFALSSNRKAIRWQTVAWGIGLQISLAWMVLRGELLSSWFAWLPFSLKTVILAIMVQILLVRILVRRSGWGAPTVLRWARIAIAGQILVCLLKFNLVANFFVFMRGVVNRLIAYSGEGARFVFGALGAEHGEHSVGLILAFQVLPTIIFMASLFAILYYLKVMPVVVEQVSTVMNRFLKTSGAESVSVAASMFMGQVEAPLTIRPFLAEMTRSELMTVMTAGMAHVSGGIMAAYVLIAHVDIVHLLTAVVMTAPGAIMIAKIMVPETKVPKTSGNVKIEISNTDVNLVDAAARGASEGIHMAINVAGMLIAFVALVAMIDGILGFLHQDLEALALRPFAGNYIRTLAHYFPSNMQQILGVIFQPIAWTMGISWKDSYQVGNLLGTRMVLNEMFSFLQLAQIRETLDPRSFMISTFALCGFANFGSIAIQVGGIGALAPTRRHDLAALGFRAMIAGTLANFLSATIAGLVS